MKGQNIMREFIKEEKELIHEMYNNGEKIRDIASILHCRNGTLSNYLKNNGYEKRKRNMIKGAENLSKGRKHYFNESFFENIDTEEKAYWLGFLYADGNVYIVKQKDGTSKGGTVELTLKSSDVEHLYKFLKSIQADKDYPINKRINKIGDKTYTAFRIELNSIKMCKDLINQGCVPQKSLILSAPNINENLIHHFIRGYFDGDGCVSFNENNHDGIYSILGTYELLSFICSHVNYISSTPQPKIVKRNGLEKNYYDLRFYSEHDQQMFYEYIYQPSNICLERKYELATKFYVDILKHKISVA